VKIRVNRWQDFFGAIFAGLVVVAFCLILLPHDPLIFWNDDYELSILPVFADVARSWHEGHWPLLSPYSWVCGNLAGEYQYGTFSIFVNAAVILIWKFPLTFPQQAAALSITHLFVLAAGAFLLARDRRLPVSLSIFVAPIAALSGWMICWGATDWFGALGAFAWLPWAWWGLERSLDQNRGRYRFLWPVPFVYLVVTGGFPYTVVMLGLLIVWLGVKALAERKRLGAVVPMLIGAALGFGLAAPAYLAILDYVHGSAREVQPAAAHWQWIVPWRALPGLILPCWTVNWADFSSRYLPHSATELACGLIAPVALVAGLITRTRELVRRIKWELLLLLFMLVLAMMPSVGLFRWSFRWLPMFHLVLAICAAEALRENGLEDRRARGLLVLLLVGVTAIAMLIWNTGGAYSFPLTWIFLVIAAIYAVAEFFLGDRSLGQWMPPLLTFAALLATYLCIPPNCGVPKYNFSQELTKPEPLDHHRLYLAVYSPAEAAYRKEYRSGPTGQVARPGSTPMWAQLRFINGYSPIRPAGVARELKFFTHGEIDGDVGRYLVENQSGTGGILAELGVDGLVIAREIAVEPQATDWELEFSNDEGRVFFRKGERLGLARSIGWIDSRPNEEFAIATLSNVRDQRNSVEFDVAVPEGDKSALVTFSRPYFRGYRANLNGRRLKVDSYRGLFPLIEVPPGSSGRLVLSYRPWWLIVGGTVAGVSLVIFIGAWFVAVGRGD
jgi:hypothetical protein